MADAARHAAERGESPAEQLDRQWSELLQELRVVQTALTLLSGFLLTLPFQGRFTELDATLRLVFLIAVGAAAAATAFVVVPVALHRHVFREHRKDELVDVSHRMAQLGLGLMVVTIVAVTWLAFGFVLGGGAGPIAAVITAVALVGAWVVLPRVVARGTPSSRYGHRT